MIRETTISPIITDFSIVLFFVRQEVIIVSIFDFFQKYGKIIIYTNMKYIKFFEEKSGKLYQEIGLDEWRDLIGKQTCDFSAREKSFFMGHDGEIIPGIVFKLRPWIRTNKLINYYYAIDSNRFVTTVYYSGEKNPDMVDISSRLLHIIKLDDDWFLCTVDGYRNGGNWTKYFYKCDTWDGLVEFLKDFQIFG